MFPTLTNDSCPEVFPLLLCLLIFCLHCLYLIGIFVKPLNHYDCQVCQTLWCSNIYGTGLCYFCTCSGYILNLFLSQQLWQVAAVVPICKKGNIVSAVTNLSVFITVFPRYLNLLCVIIFLTI